MKRRMMIILCILLSAAMLSACAVKPVEERSNETEEVKERVVEPEEVERNEEEEILEDKDKDNEEELNALEEEIPEDKKTGEFVAGTSQSDATMIPLGRKITGKLLGYEEGWFAFTTGNEAESVYNISFLISTMKGKLWGELYDESGNKLEYKPAFGDGKAVTISTDQLETNTTYYIRLESNEKATLGYTLIVRDSKEVVSIVEQNNPVVEEDSDEEEIIPGRNQYNAILIPLGSKVFGTLDQNNCNAWFTFTTGEEVGSVYNITFVNETADSYYIDGVLVDEYGNVIDSERADDDGRATTIVADQLDVNTTYYIGLFPRNGYTIDYSLFVKDPYSETMAYRTAGSFSEARGASLNGEIFAGTNQNDATLIPLGTKVSGSISESDSTAWFAFTTGEKRGVTYNVTYTYSSSDGGYRYFHLLDEYGESVKSGGSNADGEAQTISANQLNSNTTYYILFDTKGSTLCDYSLLIEAPDERNPLKFEEPLVFEVPFEINETQIKFVINKAEFINLEKAKEGLKPVAEAILEHPDHSILIAGTTATDGTQESCVDLSNRRAQAVKDLLVNTYQVPESQIQIIGLGYEDDPFERGKDRDSSGKFVESEGRKNRRVVILDFDDPIAQEILKNNK